MYSIIFISVVVVLGSHLTIPVGSFFDPLSLYVGADEGFALAHIDTENGQSHVFDMFSYHHSDTMFGHHDDEYEVYQIKTSYNKMKIRREGVLDNTYYVDFWYYDGHDIEHGHDTVERIEDRNRYFRSVPLGDDASVALQCSNGKYLKWDSQLDSPGKDPCTSLGICDNCKFFPEVGSINPILIEIVSIEWGDMSDDIVENPSVLSRDQQDNWSDVDVTNTFHISYTDTTVDTTTWEQTWGFEFTTKFSSTIKIPFASMTFTVSATTKYSGKTGGSSQVTDSTTYDKSATYPCPPKHRCFYNLIGRHLNNAVIPFTATVRKTDGIKTEEWEEHGVWEGVKVYDTYAEFCTEDLVTGENNCPHQLRMPIQGI